eukprot:GILJ01018419.1.p1 GENE.GILJ01018419.1~~GILJ01018419.1.p1  ORF type:complete len:747 (+),score=121.75 GILJ01018419.1:110-2242(+)
MEFLLSKHPVPSSASSTPVSGTSVTTAHLASLLNELPAIHVDMISILINVCDYKIDAVQFLELYNNNVTACIDALCGYLRHLHVDKPLSVMLVAGASSPTDGPASQGWTIVTAHATAVIRCVYELSTWKTFKEAFYSAEGDKTDVAMPQIQAKFTDHICLVSKTLTFSPFLPLVTRLLEDWLDVINACPSTNVSAALIGATEAALSNALLLITNMMSFTIEFTAVFRKYAAINSGGLLEKVVLPMVGLELDLLEGKRIADSNDAFDNAKHLARAARMLQMLLKVLGLLCFRTRVLRPTLLAQYPGLCKRLITNEVIMNSDFKVEFFALVIRFAVNAELDDSVSVILDKHKTKLDDRQRLVLALRLGNPAERLYPLNVFCPVYTQLRSVFVIDSKLASNPDVISSLGSTVTAETPKFVFSFGPSSATAPAPAPPTIDEKREARRQAFGFLADAAEVFFDGPEQQHLRKMKRRQGGTSTTEKVRTRREAMRRRKAFLAKKAKRDGGKKAAATKDDDDDVWEDLEDDEDIEEGIEMQDMTSSTGAMEALVVDEDEGANASSSPTATYEVAVLQDAVQTQKNQQADTTSVKVRDAPSVVRLTNVDSAPSVVAPTPATEAYVQAGPFDLRPFRTRPPPFGVDPRYLCALTKQLMTTPVISPSGDIYEKESIVAFIKEAGPHKNKCPLTGDELYPRDLVVDTGLKRELAVVAANFR